MYNRNGAERDTIMNYEKLDKKAILSWRIDRIIGFIFVAITLAVVMAFAKNMDRITPYINYLYIAATLFILYKLIGIIIYPEIEYRQWGYIITEDKVEFRHGIFFVTTTVIPIVRVQHITMSRGPIYRKLGLSKVKIFLASGSFDIEGLSESTANIISENLKSKVFERLNNSQSLE